VDIERTLQFSKWLDGLKDLHARAQIQARIARLANGNPATPEISPAAYPS
jgi:putative component of toxin-antitoxin plasmid stabilization module